MDNINFIPANQLPITDAKEVNVLCVADGTVKQKSSKDLGGASSWNDLKDKPFYSETDADGNETVHKIDPKYLPAVGSHWFMLNDGNVTASEGIYEALKNCLVNGVPVFVTTFRMTHSDDESTCMTAPAGCIYWSSHVPGNTHIGVDDGNGTIFFAYDDGRLSYYQD